eukprot:617505-Pyramimonas_sp.AAC.1
MMIVQERATGRGGDIGREREREREGERGRMKSMKRYRDKSTDAIWGREKERGATAMLCKICNCNLSMKGSWATCKLTMM